MSQHTVGSSATPTQSQIQSPGQPGIDPRGPRFAAAVTSVVLIAVLLLVPGPLGVALLALQALLFAAGAAFGVGRTPVATVFRSFVRPRLAAPDHLEDPRPPRFAQGVGLVFAVVGLVGFGLGADLLGYVAVGAALVAALLNATIGFCLGCEVYLLGRRALAARNSVKIPALEN